MNVNIYKTKVVHFREKNEALTDFEFKLGDSILEICHKYKYLGFILICIYIYETCYMSL